MSNKKLKLLIIPLVLLSFHGCIVFDAIRYVQEEANHILRMNKFAEIIFNLSLIKDQVKDIKESFDYNYKIAKAIVIKNLNTDEFNDILLNGSYLGEGYYKDIWTDLWKHLKSLMLKYPELDDYEYLTQSDTYRKNEAYRKRIDRIIQLEKAKVDDMQNTADFIADMRYLENERMDKIKLFEKYAEQYAREGSYGKLQALSAWIDLERMRIQSQIQMVQRISLEQELKRKVNDKVINSMSLRDIQGCSLENGQ